MQFVGRWGCKICHNFFDAPLFVFSQKIFWRSFVIVIELRAHFLGALPQFPFLKSFHNFPFSEHFSKVFVLKYLTLHSHRNTSGTTITAYRFVFCKQLLHMLQGHQQHSLQIVMKIIHFNQTKQRLLSIL